MSGDLEIIIENQEIIIEQLGILKDIFTIIGVGSFGILIDIFYKFIRDWMR